MSDSASPATPATPPAASAPAAPPKPPMPAKPAAPAKKGEDRRNFLVKFVTSPVAVAWAAFTTAITFMTLGTARFLFPNVLSEPPSSFRAGFLNSYEEGVVTDQYKELGAWVIRNRDDLGRDTLYALSTTCTHLGCTPNWLEAEQKFKCPCHGSGFYKDGVNFEGPAPRPLERYAISLADDGQLLVDKSRTFQEEMGQWKDPASFVPV